VMQAPGPVDGNVCLLFVQLHGTGWSTARRQELTELKQTIKNWTVLPHINSFDELYLHSQTSEFDVVITVILGHLLSTGFVGTLKHRRTIEQQVMRHADSVGLHGMPLSISVSDEIRHRPKLARLANVPG
uniref:Uncharacterized protein n=1 Tax=Lates calcarifer TaxID=8187 RepID=A0A4W6DR88_LATCA